MRTMERRPRLPTCTTCSEPGYPHDRTATQRAAVVAGAAGLALLTASPAGCRGSRPSAIHFQTATSRRALWVWLRAYGIGTAIDDGLGDRVGRRDSEPALPSPTPQ